MNIKKGKVKLRQEILLRKISLPSRRLGSLYNQTYYNYNNNQKEKGSYDDSPPHGFEKSR